MFPFHAQSLLSQSIRFGKMSMRCASLGLNKRDPSTQMDCKSIQLKSIHTLPPKSGPTAAPAIASSNTNPDNLPHLPLPRLEDTLAKYLRSVQPLLSPEQFQKAANVVVAFASGGGVQLQNLLKAKADQSENWLADWWTKVAYLSYRSPVVVHSSPGRKFPTQSFDTELEWCRYAARVTWAALRYKQMIDNDEIPSDKVGQFQLDMAQYKKIFGTCRIPAKDVDDIAFHPKSRHIVVAYKNAFYKVIVYEPSSDRFLSINQLTELLLLILNQNPTESVAVGLLTSEHRDTLAVAYENLVKDPVNRASVEEIASSLFLLCLDGRSSHFDLNDAANVACHQLMHGGGSKQNSGNRWFDKTLQFVVNRNGINGMTFEHSPAEGVPVAALTNFILKHLKTQPVDVEIFNNRQPTKLEFHISPEIERDICKAAENIDRLSSNLEMNVVHFKTYGKDFIKWQQLSPDSYIQMAMQYAFYKLHSEPGAQYETATLRRFIHGRTEAIRSCSMESVAFAQAMCSPPNTVSDQTKVQLLRVAVKAHKDYTIMAMSGEGVDRHLLGLKLIARENHLPVPELYSDDAFVRSTHFRVSSSQLAIDGDAFVCFGPVVVDGYGICYNPRDDEIYLAVSAFNSCPITSAKAMGDTLIEALETMHKVLSRADERKISKL